MQVFYLLLLILFASLIVATLTRCLLDISTLREELRHQRTRQEYQEEHLARVRDELEEVELDLELLKTEQEGLEQQEICMRALDPFDAAGDGHGDA